jgi:glycosyltransferase involved in cell wall biosynthesis
MPSPTIAVPTQPLVSIGLPVYNGQEYLREAIDSLLGQTYRNIELIISDNASTDGTQALCEAYVVQDARVRYSRRPQNIGGVRNHSHVVAQARGEFFMWGSSDDRWQPTYVERCVELLRAEPSLVLAYTLNATMDESGRPTGVYAPGYRLDTDDVVERFRQLTQTDNPIEPFYGVMRLSAMRSTAPLALHPGFDRFVLAELGLLGRFRQVPEPLYTRRIHSNQSVRAFPKLRERYYWINPSARDRLIVLPMFEFGYRFAAAAVRLAPSLRVRRQCLWHMLKWCNWNRQRLWADLLGRT